MLLVGLLAVGSRSAPRRFCFPVLIAAALLVVIGPDPVRDAAPASGEGTASAGSGRP